MPAKITKMTRDQAARMEQFARDWIAIGLSTESADFDAATAAALKAYALCNRDRPMVILRMGSPYGATLGGILAWGFLRELFKSQVESQVWSGVYNDRGGAFWASWVAYVVFMRDVLGWRDPVLERFEIDETLTKSCGWVWWHENVLAISDRPSEIHRDDRGRLHSATGPSIAYRDGWRLHHWHGVLVPDWVIEAPSRIEISAIDDERNAEVRRVMIERYGEARYLTDSGAELLCRDRYGELYRKRIPDDEDLVMVRVLNSTPEPDGSIKPYMIRVDPKCRTPQEAVAWTFGLEPAQYRPTIET